MKGVCFNRLTKIPTAKGAVMHALKASESSFDAFGEVYFSEVYKGMVKGWKLHRQMILNLIVPVGDVRFYFLDNECVRFLDLGSDNYGRLTVSPGIWFGFEGLSEHNIIMNLASIEHKSNEGKSREIDRLQLEFAEPL